MTTGDFSIGIYPDATSMFSKCNMDSRYSIMGIVGGSMFTVGARKNSIHADSQYGWIFYFEIDLEVWMVRGRAGGLGHSFFSPA